MLLAAGAQQQTQKSALHETHDMEKLVRLLASERLLQTAV
jgi:hypothetical protein